MAFAVNIYQEQAVKYLGAYGIEHQSLSTTWKLKDASMFAILCSTDDGAYSSSFTGTVEELLAAGVTELTTGNGYFQGGKPMPRTSIRGPFTSNYGNGMKYLPVVTYIVSTVPYVTQELRPVQWLASGGSISAKSMILCIESPVSAAATIYGRSYPLAMIDFDGTKTATNGNVFDINWNANGAINWTR
jgi:hypothetical protein